MKQDCLSRMLFKQSALFIPVDTFFKAVNHLHKVKEKKQFHVTLVNLEKHHNPYSNLVFKTLRFIELFLNSAVLNFQDFSNSAYLLDVDYPYNLSVSY